MNSSAIRRPAPREVRVSVNAVGSMVAASIADVGSPADGFVRGDRVAYPLSIGVEPVVSVDTLVGIPRNVSDRQAADLLAPGLLARAMITKVRPLARGQRVRVDLRNSVLRQMVCAWVLAQGGILVEHGEADIVYDEQARARAAVEASQRQGRLQQAATDVFQAMRGGVFDEVRVSHRVAHPAAA